MEPGTGDIRALLTQANLARVRGNWPEAERHCQEATTLAPDNAEAWELLGDACLAQRKGAQAINYFRQARQLSPNRPALEEKIGRASLLIAQQEMMLAAPDLYLAGREQKRQPSIAALCSLVLPGLGQIYNRDWWKGAILLVVYLGVVLLLGRAVAEATGTLLNHEQRIIDLTRIVNTLASGPRLALGVVATVVWMYAIGDAAYMASRGDEVWTPDGAPRGTV